MARDEKVRDFEDNELLPGDTIVFTAGGLMGRGKILDLRMKAVFGAMLVQSLINPARQCAVAPMQSVLIERAPLPAEPVEVTAEA